MNGLSNFLNMGGYGFFIWTSYGIVIFVLIGLLIQALRFQRASKMELEALNLENIRQSRPRHQQNSDET